MGSLRLCSSTVTTHFIFFRISKFVSARHGSMYAGKIFLTRNGGIEKLDYTKQISLVCVCVTGPGTGFVSRTDWRISWLADR